MLRLLGHTRYLGLLGIRDGLAGLVMRRRTEHVLDYLFTPESFAAADREHDRSY